MQMVRYAGLYARNLKRKLADVIRAALDALRLQFPLFDLESLTTIYQRIKWRERIIKSFGYYVVSRSEAERMTPSYALAVAAPSNWLRSGSPNAVISG
jgi:hypothetical protein